MAIKPKEAGASGTLHSETDLREQREEGQGRKLLWATGVPG